MTDNMRLWNKVKTTPPHQITIDSSKTPPRKSVKASIQKENATSAFGLYGTDWGIVVGSEVYNRAQIGDTHLIHYTANFYYTFEGKRGEMPIAASIKEAYVTNGGKGYLKVDEEAVKKVRTDALTKGMSELGFNADIFQGLHDLNGYSDYALEVTNEAQAERSEAETIKEAEEYAEWKAKAIAVYKDLNTNKAIETTFTGHIRKATKIGDTKGIKEFEAAKKARQGELSNG